MASHGTVAKAASRPGPHRGGRGGRKRTRRSRPAGASAAAGRTGATGPRRPGRTADPAAPAPWEHTCTPFRPLPGFEPWIPGYPGYSADFFDDKHTVVFGGSWATGAPLLRRSFRNWFQTHYPYVFSKFRRVRDDGSYLLELVLPISSVCLDQKLHIVFSRRW